MDIFATVKNRVTTREAAAFYGIAVKKNGMICCPFHPDRHPSMKVDIRYYCFGCHETGDVIDFVGRLFGIRPYEAAKKLASDFHLDPRSPAPAATDIHAAHVLHRQRAKESETAALLIDYESQLKERKHRFAPRAADAIWDIRFADACEKLPYISDLIDRLYSPDARLRKATLDEIGQSDVLAQMQANKNAWRKENCIEQSRTETTESVAGLV